MTDDVEIEALLRFMECPLDDWQLPIFICKGGDGYLAQSVLDEVDVEVTATTAGEATVKCMARMLRHFVENMR